MTSTWFSAFYDGCLKGKPNMLALVNFTQYYVGGKHGGKVTSATWNSSFHGYDEVMGDRYQLCAHELGKGSAWLEFEACQNGVGGAVGIADIPKNSEKCAKQAAIDWGQLSACATGEQGLALFKTSVYYTSDHNITYDTLVPGSGKLENIPVVHIAGKAFTGLDAYHNLTQHICQHTSAADCGCDEALLRRRAVVAQAKFREMEAQATPPPPALVAIPALATIAVARSEDPPFPKLSSTFTMKEALWLPDPAASGPPNVTRDIVWDTAARRSLYYAHFPRGLRDSTTPAFEYQLKRCDVATPVFWDVKGDPTADPSTYTCFKKTGSAMKSDCPAQWKPFWSPIDPKRVTFNGTDVINGVSCNRFQLADGMGQQTFWATATAPCRAITTGQREDYPTFDTTTPPASAFDGPTWLKDLKCTQVDAATEMG
jgi:hypothetical protein